MAEHDEGDATPEPLDEGTTKGHRIFGEYLATMRCGKALRALLDEAQGTTEGQVSDGHRSVHGDCGFGWWLHHCPGQQADTRRAERTQADDVEALAQIVAQHQRTINGNCYCGEWPPDAHDDPWTDHIARALLASDWLAQRDKRLREQIAEAIETERGAQADSGFPPAWFTAMDRAARIAREVPRDQGPDSLGVSPMASDGHLDALIEKYERLASIETARFCRAQDVVADLRALAMGACDRPDCEPCNTAAARILDDLVAHGYTPPSTAGGSDG